MKLAAAAGNFNYPDADSGNAAFPNPARPSPPPRPWRLDLGSPGKRILRRSIKFVFEKGVPLIGLSCVFQPCIRYEVYPVSSIYAKGEKYRKPFLICCQASGVNRQGTWRKNTPRFVLLVPLFPFVHHAISVSKLGVWSRPLLSRTSISAVV